VLPYRLLAGVEPCRGGWLVVSAKLQGVSLFAEPPHVFSRFADVLETTPPYEFVALHCPIGLPSEHAQGGRQCDREARRLLGSHRGAAIVSPPSQPNLERDDPAGLSAVGRATLPYIREVHGSVASYHQRVVFEVHPELCFYQLNGERPLLHPKSTEEGRLERLTVLQKRMPGLDRALNNKPRGVSDSQLLDACADLWTARRLVARSVLRLPEVPEWNPDGLKMELVC
jgi:predicted RNase H-like nuclease